MRNNKALKYLLIIIFFIMIAVFPLSWLLMPDSLRNENSENRILSELSLPKSLDELFAFPDSLTTWYSDHLPFKEQLVSAESELEAAVFNQLDSDHATLGTKKPWLFYKEKDGEQVENYKHTNSFSETMLDEIKDELYRLKNKLDENGIDFALLIAPDKETIYGEYMPTYIKVLKDMPDRTDVLLNYLAEYAPDIKVIFPREELLNAKTTFKYDASGVIVNTNTDYYFNADNSKNNSDTYASAGKADSYNDNASANDNEISSEDIPVYYESDTHWNRIGAKVAFDTIMNELSKEDKEYANAVIDINFTNTYYDGITGAMGTDHLWNKGDIQKLCKLSSDYNSTEFYPERLPYARTLYETISPGNEVIAQKSISEADSYTDKKIYFCGDSYPCHLVDYVREGFRESTIISRYYLDLDEVIDEKPDIFIYEMPERYLADLHGLPGVSAPAIEITDEYQHMTD